MLSKLLWNKQIGRLFIFYLGIEAKVKYFLLPRKVRKNYKRRISALNTFKFENFNYEKVCIFASYSNSLTLSTKLFIKKIVEKNYFVIHINNLKTGDMDLKFLKDNKCLSFDRLNIGRDIGAFQDGFLYLLNNNFLKSINFLCFANDSIQVIPGEKLDEFFDKVIDFENSDNQALFTHKSFEPLPHYQSFFKILKNEIFTRKEYINFWKRYLPFSDRQHSIWNYEIKISRKIFNKYQKVSLLNQTFIVEEKVNILRKNGKKPPSIFSDNYILPYNFQGFKSTIDGIDSGNPTHSGAFVYPHYGFCPFIKKDLCFQGTFSFAQVSKGYRELLEQSCDDQEIINKLIEEFSQIILYKGIPSSYIYRPLLAYRLGLMP